MKHLFIDEYSNLNSVLHRLDPRTKIITNLTFILFIVLTPITHLIQFLLYFLLLLFLIFLSKVPVIYIFKRSLAVIPFAVLVSLSGITIFRNVCIKAFLSVICLTLLSSTTSFPHLLKGFEKLNFPRIIIMVLSFMYRYLFLTIDELMRMKQAKDSRTIRPKKFFELKALTNLIGSLFISSYDRGERVYLAMCSRGFNGRIKTLDDCFIKFNDIIFGLGLPLLLVIIQLVRF